MQIVHVNSWAACREILYRFSQLDRGRRNQWWFRGLCNFEHTLLPTIDRGRTFTNDALREDAIKEMTREFRREAISLGMGDRLPRGDPFELLARHHGLPSPYLDWSRSPYVAACFSFLTCDPVTAASVGLFALDLSQIKPEVIDPAVRKLELVDEPEHVLFNRRAIQQRGVFMRRSTVQETVESLLADSLFKFKIPASEKDEALRDLDQSMVNATNLYYDLDGAARTAAWRCS